MGRDEAGTVARVKRLRSEVIEPRIAEHGGRLVKTTGDGFLMEFPSPVEAVECAMAIQQTLNEKAAIEPSEPLYVRIGINIGDIIVEKDGDVFGDGVNIAARLEQLANAGGIAVTGKVYEEVRDKLAYDFEDRGDQQVKNISRAVRVYHLRASEQNTTETTSLRQSTAASRSAVNRRPAIRQHEWGASTGGLC